MIVDPDMSTYITRLLVKVDAHDAIYGVSQYGGNGNLLVSRVLL